MNDTDRPGMNERIMADARAQNYGSASISTNEREREVLRQLAQKQDYASGASQSPKRSEPSEVKMSPTREALAYAQQCVSILIGTVTLLEERLGWTLGQDQRDNQVQTMAGAPPAPTTCSSLTDQLRDIGRNLDGQASRLHRIIDRLEL